jgi:hypothetical protein
MKNPFKNRYGYGIEIGYLAIGQQNAYLTEPPIQFFLALFKGIEVFFTGTTI